MAPGERFLPELGGAFGHHPLFFAHRASSPEEATLLINQKYRYKEHPENVKVREFFLSGKSTILCSDIMRGKMEQEYLEDLISVITDALQHDRKH